VKICSLYGAGFYYIPGTDTCIKIGGWVRMQFGNGYNGNMTNGPMVGNVNNRQTNDFMTRNRGYITADARSQTEYGTLRAYIAVGLSNDNPLPGAAVTSTGGTALGGISANAGSTVGFSANRAFIQLGGLTAGLAQSFYDFMNYSAVSYNGGSVWTPAGADTGDTGQQVLAYTAQLGGGLSATLSLENPRNGAVVAFGAAGVPVAGGAVGAAGFGATNYGAPIGREGNKFPDVVANLRVDQAWGSAQLMGALHDASAGYYDVALAGHPANVLGYAVGAGLRINAPTIGRGDYFQTQFNWTKGAIKYMSAGSSLSMVSGSTTGTGTYADGVYLTNGTDSVHLTTAWSAGASYEHNWNPSWKTSLYGGYSAISLDQATGCTVPSIATGCSGNWDTWQVGTRTAWAPVANLEVGVDVMYTNLDARNTGLGAATSSDQSAWVSYLRIQRNFYP